MADQGAASEQSDPRSFLPRGVLEGSQKDPSNGSAVGWKSEVLSLTIIMSQTVIVAIVMV